jgi:hypothetical protein
MFLLVQALIFQTYESTSPSSIFFEYILIGLFFSLLTASFVNQLWLLLSRRALKKEVDHNVQMITVTTEGKVIVENDWRKQNPETHFTFNPLAKNSQPTNVGRSSIVSAHPTSQ